MSSTWNVPIASTATLQNSRTPINDALEALRTLHSGASEPASTVAYMWWLDTTNGLLKQRNAGDTAWVIEAKLYHADSGETATTYFGMQRAIHKTVGDSSGTVAIDWSDASEQHVTITGNITTLTFSNPRYGETLTLAVKQGGSGSYTISWPASVRHPAGSAPTLTTTVGKTDIIQFRYNAVDAKYDRVGLIQNL